MDNRLWTDAAIPRASVNAPTGNSRAEGRVEGRQPNSSLDKDAFLRLLITQLQYQDPLNPMDDRDFLAQMAQFTTLEQMQNMNKSYERARGCAMIGREIDASVSPDKPGAPHEVQGKADAALWKNGAAYVQVGEDEVPLDAVWRVSE
ncbi:MAG: hypothetical protein LBT44_08595 [Clostridiales bacterium]|jgi:flagellar basal-body rod modification protein FlgD|nr:hypothetical protein [Clostridiales bacterium]